MENTFKNELKQINVSKTAFRTLFLLKLLIQKPLTFDEIYKLLSQEEIIGKKLSTDTITITINNLIKAGCIIDLPQKKNDYKYILISHPFNINLNSEHIKNLNKIRKEISKIIDFNTIIAINKLYEKIGILTNSDEVKISFKNNAPFNDINFKIINELKKYLNSNHLLSIEYLSPLRQKENFEIIPEKLFYQNKRLYLWGFSTKHNDIVYLRTDKIKKINSVSLLKQNPLKNGIKVKYRIGDKIFEEIISSEFNFFQKISSNGINCEILEPKEMRTKFHNMLKSVKDNYK